MTETKLPVPGGLVGRLALAVILWIRQRPYVLPPRAWSALILAFLIAAVFAVILGVSPSWLPLALLGSAVIPVVPRSIWARMRRRSNKVVVFLARFGDDNSPEYALRASTHLTQLERRLGQNDYLRAAIEVRALRAPVKQPHAKRILRHTRARAVVSGTGLEVAGSARWEAWTMVRWRQQVGFSDRMPGGGFIGFIKSRLTSGKSSATAGDARADVRILTADGFPAKHADGIEGTLLLIAGAERPDEEFGRECLEGANSFRDALPLEARAVWEIGRGMDTLTETGDPSAAARSMEAAADDDAEHILLWNACLAMLAAAERRDLVSPAERVRVGLRAVSDAPDDFFANMGVAYGYGALEQFEEAIPYFESALSSPKFLIDPMPAVFDLAEVYVGERGMDIDAAFSKAAARLPWRHRLRIVLGYRVAKIRQQLKGETEPPPVASP